MSKANLSLVSSESDLSSTFQLPAGFSVVEGFENQSPFQQEFHYQGGESAHVAIKQLREAGLNIGAKGAGSNTGRGTFHLVECNPYSRS